MGFEARLGNRPFLKAAILGAGMLGVAPFLRDRKNAQWIVGAALGKKVDCGSCVEAENAPYPFDAIVVPGGGIRQVTDGSWLPSVNAQLRLEAAVRLWKQEQAPFIVLLDGAVGSDQDPFTNKKYLQVKAGELEVEIPDEVVIAEDQVSKNTAQNMIQLKEIANRRRLLRFLMVTNAFHEVRATLFSCRNEIATSSLSAEEVILEEDPSRRQEIDEHYASGKVRMLALKEKVEVGFMLWDPNGSFQTFLRNMYLLQQNVREGDRSPFSAKATS